MRSIPAINRSEALDIYDTDSHFIASHSVSTALGGAASTLPRPARPAWPRRPRAE